MDNFHKMKYTMNQKFENIAENRQKVKIWIASLNKFTIILY